MDSILEEIKLFNKTLENFENYFGNMWSGVLPVNQSYLNYAGKTLDWAHGENKNNLNPVYKDKKIVYTIGDRGFRTYPEYKPTSSKKIYTFGCSMTFGQSAPDEHTWPMLLAEKLGSWNVHNFGVPAAGAGEISRICYQTIVNSKKEDYPDAVFILFPETFRTEYIGNNVKSPFKFSVNLHMGKYPTKESLQLAKVEGPMETFRKSKELAYYEYTGALHSFFEVVRSFKLIQEILTSRNIPWFWYTWYPPMLSLKRKTIETYFSTYNTLLDETGFIIFDRDGGRDNTHAGFNYNNRLAEEFAQLYKTYESNKLYIEENREIAS